MSCVQYHASADFFLKLSSDNATGANAPPPKRLRNAGDEIDRDLIFDERMQDADVCDGRAPRRRKALYRLLGIRLFIATLKLWTLVFEL